MVTTPVVPAYGIKSAWGPRKFYGISRSGDDDDDDDDDDVGDDNNNNNNNNK